MMSTANNNNNNGADYMRLKAELGALNEALSQCQADKEFVWSLWKRLQVASPDVTQAISLVVQREREKVEKGNRRVLEMLHSKDVVIDKLQKTLSVQTRALSDQTNRSAELERELAKLLATHNDLQHRHRMLQDEVTNEKRISASRLAIRDLDKENLDLKQQMSKLESQLTSMSKQNEELLELTESQKLKSKNLESDHDEVQQNYDHIMSELSDAKKRLRQSEQKLRESTREATGKCRELELVRKELSDIWVSHSQTTDHTSQQADLIRQLQTLHKDTRQMLKNQEDTFTMENAVLHSKLEKMEETEADLRQQHALYEQKIQEQQDMIVGLRKKMSDAEDEQHHHHHEEPPPASYSVKTSSASDRVSQSTPLYSVRSHGRQTTTRLDDARTRHMSPDSRRDQRHVSPCQSPGSRRDQSPYGDDHREFDVKMLRQLLTTMEKKLNHYHQLLHVKDDELKELKVAHSRRLERLRSVVTNYKLVKKQLRIVEEECYGAKTKKKKLSQCHPKSLQNEDTDHVWNELAFFKTEAKNLAVDKMNLQEQVDTLRVQGSQDSASLYELHACLEQEKEELKFLVDQQREQQEREEQEQEQRRATSPEPNVVVQREMQQDIDRTTVKLKKLASRVSQLQDDNRSLEKQQTACTDERRIMKAEVNSLRQIDADHRMKMTDLNREIARLQRELKKSRRKKLAVKTSSSVKQYQMKMRSSLQQMSRAVGDMEADGWEEVSDTEDVGTVTSLSDVMTGDSLGQAIVDRAHDSRLGDDSSDVPQSLSTPNSPHNARARARQVESIDDHVRRMNRINEPPVKDGTPPPKSECRKIMKPGYAFVSASPVISSKVGFKVTNGGASVQQVTSLKQRIKELQQQVKVLKCIKDAHSKALLDQKASFAQMEADLTATTQKLQTSKSTMQRLTGEVERTRTEKDDMSRRLEEMSAASVDRCLHLEEDWVSLTGRLKIASTDVSKQLAQIKHLKAENEAYEQKMKLLNERVNHLERDVAQKRNLVEEMRTKLREVHTNTESDAAAMLDVETRMKGLSDANHRSKIQLEAMRQRLATVTEDKYNSEDKVIKLSDELEKKCKQALDLQRKCGDLQATLGAVESTAKQQLQSLAHQSEAAIDMAQTKLLHTSLSLKEFHKFISLLAHALLSGIHHARLMQRQHKYNREKKAPQGDMLAPSMRRAKNLASDLLNMSSSDIDDLLSVCDDTDDSLKIAEDADDGRGNDKEWTNKWQKVIRSKEEFAMAIVNLFVQKIDERCEIIMKIGAT